MPAFGRKVLDDYKDAICEGPRPPWLAYGALISGFAFGVNSLSEIARNFAWSPSVSTLQRSTALFNSKTFMKRLRIRILKYLKNMLNLGYDLSDFCIAIDDTSIEKYSHFLPGFGKWASSSGKVYAGHKVLVIALVNRRENFSIPIFYEIIKKKIESGYKLFSTCILNALGILEKEGFPLLDIVMDSGFGSSSLLNTLNKKNYKYVIEIKSNRNIRISPNKKSIKKKPRSIFKKGKRIKIKYKKGKTKYASEKLIHVDGIDKKQKGIAVYNFGLSQNAFAFYISNNLNYSAYDIWCLSRDRWKIEELFRDLKQNLSWGSLPCFIEGAFELSICIPFAIVASLRIDAEKWNHENALSHQIGKMLKKIREENFQTAIGIVLHQPNNVKIQILKNRRQKNRLTRKPTNISAEEYSKRKVQAA